MKNLSMPARTGIVGCLALGATALAAAPASAATALVGFDLNTSSGYTVASTCKIVAGYTTDIRFVTYVIEAEASAAGPSVAVATGVSCTVYSGGTARGGASQGLPGPTAVAVGQAIVPVGQIPTICVSGSATFLDGKTVPAKPCP